MRQVTDLFYKNFKFKIPLALMVCWLLGCQFLFYNIQKTLADKIANSIQNQLRQELDFSDFHFLSRSITDFTLANSIRCSTVDKIIPDFEPILDLKYMSSECRTSIINLNGTLINLNLKTLNGNVFRFSFISNNPELYFITLWSFRIFGCLIIIILSYLYESKSKYQNELIKKDLDFSKKIKIISEQVAHDIRSPLSALNLSISVIKEKIPDQHYEIIIHSLNRINNISNDLLNKRKDDINKIIGTNFSTNNYKAHFLPSILKNLINEKEIEISKKHTIRLFFDCKESNNLFCKIDEEKFNRTISNLLNNSIESFHSENGNININLSTNKENKIILQIQDNGKGIPKKYLEQLFTPNFTFGKNNSATSGNGLGLSTSKEIIESFGGTLNIDSELNIGTCVQISLNSEINPQWQFDIVSTTHKNKIIYLGFSKNNESEISSLLKEKHFSITYYDNKDLLEKNILEDINSISKTLFFIEFDDLNYIENFDLISNLAIEKHTYSIVKKFSNSKPYEHLNSLKLNIIPEQLLKYYLDTII